MKKKRGKKKEVKHKVKKRKAKPAKTLAISKQSAKIDALIQNNVSLQKIIVDLALNINNVSQDISKMLSLFEEANKSFKTGELKSGWVNEEKINQLLGQNKAIAKGLVLLEEFLSEKPKPLPKYKA